MENPKITHYIAQLEDPDWVVRAGARNALVEIGAEAVPALLEVLRRGDSNPGHYAISVLQDIGRGNKDLLTAALNDGDSRVREGVAKALAEVERMEQEYKEEAGRVFDKSGWGL